MAKENHLMRTSLEHSFNYISFLMIRNKEIPVWGQPHLFLFNASHNLIISKYDDESFLCYDFVKLANHLNLENF